MDSSPSKLDIEKALVFVKKVVREAGAIILSYSASPTGVERKTDDTLVSDADKASSVFIEKKLSSQFPNIPIIDEEQAALHSIKSPEYCWIVDPLDGTREYLERGENYSILIGLWHAHSLVIGIAYKPATDELFFAQRGKGAYCEYNGDVQRMHVDETPELKLVVSSSRTSPNLELLIHTLSPKAIIRMGGSIKSVAVACGAASAFICPPGQIMHLWDVCATSVIVEEAGGIISDFAGNRLDYSLGHLEFSQGIIAASKGAHRRILQAIQRIQ